MLGTWQLGQKPLGASMQADGPSWFDAIDPLQVRSYYVCVLTGNQNGLPDLVMEPSSWQATVQSGRAQFCQAVVPAIDSYVDEITARPDGDLVIRGGVIMSDGERKEHEIVRVPASTPSYDYGPQRRTGRLSGYGPASTPSSGTRTLSGIRSLSFGQGGARARSDIDWGLRPGNKAIAEGVEISVAYINYYVIANRSSAQAYMDVGERNG